MPISLINEVNYLLIKSVYGGAVLIFGAKSFGKGNPIISKAIYNQLKVNAREFSRLLSSVNRASSRRSGFAM